MCLIDISPIFKVKMHVHVHVHGYIILDFLGFKELFPDPIGSVFK